MNPLTDWGTHEPLDRLRNSGEPRQCLVWDSKLSGSTFIWKNSENCNLRPSAGKRRKWLPLAMLGSQASKFMKWSSIFHAYNKFPQCIFPHIFARHFDRANALTINYSPIDETFIIVFSSRQINTGVLCFRWRDFRFGSPTIHGTD